MLGLLVQNRAFDERQPPASPILPGFVRRALAALFRRL